MDTLGAWLQQEPARRKLTQQAVGVRAGISGATLSEILRVLATQPDDPTGCYLISPESYPNIYFDVVFCIR